MGLAIAVLAIIVFTVIIAVLVINDQSQPKYISTKEFEKIARIVRSTLDSLAKDEIRKMKLKLGDYPYFSYRITTQNRVYRGTPEMSVHLLFFNESGYISKGMGIVAGMSPGITGGVSIVYRHDQDCLYIGNQIIELKSDINSRIRQIWPTISVIREEKYIDDKER